MTPKLNALTSLRFFAAALIVIHHLQGTFGIREGALAPLELDQAVSFFFLLSGFILHYVYPTLDGVGAWRFWRNRVARIWPAHGFSLLLVVLFLPSFGRFPGSGNASLLANAAMVHAWVPIPSWFFSYNGVSWSISTEFAFYLCFPLLVRDWQRTWKLKLAASLLLAVSMVALSAALGLPRYTEGGVGYFGLVAVHPAGRLFEFVLGMCAAQLFRAVGPRLTSSRVRGTILELTSVLFAAGVSYRSAAWGEWAVKNGLTNDAGAEWLVRSGLVCLPFSALIFVMALRRGAISALLELRPLVLLGEISYSIYLLHPILIRTVGATPSALTIRWTELGIFCAILLLLAHLVWVLVEGPLRQLLGHRATPAFLGWRRSGVVWGLEAAVLGGLAAIALRAPPLALLDSASALALTERTLPALRDVRFADQFVLLGVTQSLAAEGLKLELGWEAQRSTRLAYVVAVHLLDRSGKILGQADYPQHRAEAPVAAGTRWRDEISISADRLPGVESIGLALYQPGRPPLQADHGPLDMDGRRLLVPRRGVSFGDQFMLVGVTKSFAPEGLKLELEWEARSPAKLAYFVAVHLLDGSRKIVGQVDYPQNRSRSTVSTGQRWRDEIPIAAEGLAGVKSIGLALYELGSPPVPVDPGERDWDGRRLLIPVP